MSGSKEDFIKWIQSETVSVLSVEEDVAERTDTVTFPQAQKKYVKTGVFMVVLLDTAKVGEEPTGGINAA